MRSRGVWAVARVHMATWPDAPMGGRTRGVAGWQGHGGLITLGRATRVAASPHPGQSTTRVAPLSACLPILRHLMAVGTYI